MDWMAWNSDDCVHDPTVDETESYTLAEFLARVAFDFKWISLDWRTADQWIDFRIEKLTELDAHKVILDNEHGLRGRTVLVSLSDDPKVVTLQLFFVSPTGMLELHYEPPTAIDEGRILAHKLAKLLDYKFLTHEEDEESVEADE